MHFQKIQPLHHSPWVFFTSNSDYSLFTLHQSKIQINVLIILYLPFHIGLQDIWFFFSDFSLYFILSSHSTFLFQLQFFLQSSLMKLKQTLTGYEKENKDPSWISVAILSQNSSFLSIKCIHEILGFVIYFLHPLQISSNFLLDLM